MSGVTVGVIGHVDHGKTALVRALTGTETDRLPEEKARGISIVLGFAHLDLPQGSIDLIDMPGHERFVRTMVSGATGISAFLLVIDGGEGARPQTYEHLEIARALGICRGVVALAKCDLLDEAARRSGLEAAKRLAVDAGLADAPVIATSAHSGEGLTELRAALADLGSRSRQAADQGFFWLPTDRVFAAPGFGAIVTGTLRRGRLNVGDSLEIIDETAGDSRREAKVRGLQIHGRFVESAAPGQRLAVNLRGIDAASLTPGAALATPGLLAASSWQDAEVTLGRDTPDLPNGAAVVLLAGTLEVPARLRLLACNTLTAGETGLAQLRLERSAAFPAREPFIIRQASPALTLGGGWLLGGAERRRRRYEATSLATLTALADSARAAARPMNSPATAALLAEAGEGGTTNLAIAQRLGTTPEKAQRLVETAGAIVLGRDRAMEGTAFAALSERLLAAVTTFQEAEPLSPGVTVAALQRAAPQTPEPVLEVVLARLIAQGVLVRAGGLLRRRNIDPARLQGAAERAAAEWVEARWRDGGLSPPDVAAVTGKDPMRAQAVRHLIRTGALVRTTDLVQQREVVFHADALAEAHRRLNESFSGRGFLVKEAGALLGISRKFSVPLLEHMDRLKLTRRTGDRRVMTGALTLAG